MNFQNETVNIRDLYERVIVVGGHGTDSTRVELRAKILLETLANLPAIDKLNISLADNFDAVF